jgi:UDP-3-O-[3-hydroxymyristoyl] N-acetylglucosamine deacetylase
MMKLVQSFEKSGIGLHSGEQTWVRVLPDQVGKGRYFVRVDLPGSPEIPAQIDTVRQTRLSTELAAGDVHVQTVEHLLAALAGMGIDDARIEIHGTEVPLLDGSAREWVEAIEMVAEETDIPLPGAEIQVPLWLYEGDAFVAAIPSPQRRFSYGIDFEFTAIGNQWYSWSGDRESFVTEIASARTFGLASQVEHLQQAGLIRGGSLDNALVCDRHGWLNPPLRFANEPVRHKILDLVGDLSLLGSFPIAHFIAYKASHHLHTQFAKLVKQYLTEQEGTLGTLAAVENSIHQFNFSI